MSATRCPSPSPFKVSGRAAVVLAAVAIVAGITESQPDARQAGPEFYTGKNVDIIGPYGTAPYSPTGSNPFMLGDPDKKQQNEPSCDINPSNPMIVFCGMNDYRAVDRLDVVGEPWVGASFSMDGGLTWKSHLHPGFKPKQAGAPAPAVTPIGYETAADPIVRLVPGMGLFNFIAFDRAGKGGLFLSRWYERNIEGGFPYVWRNTVEVAKGTGSPGKAGQFLDKPAMTVSVLPGTGTYNFVVPDPSKAGATRVQKVPAGVVHIAYAVFTGNANQDNTKIMYTRSTNYGDTWKETKISEGELINQAPDIAVDQAGNRVVIVWRRFATPTAKQGDAIMYVMSKDGGLSFSKPAVLSNLCSFTQGTTAGSFRTTTHPFVTFDGTAFHAVWAARQGACPQSPTSYSRIVISDLRLQGNTAQWSAPRLVDTSTGPRGHEFQPAIVPSGNRLLVTWMDTRNDLRPADGPFPDPSPDPYINDFLFAGKTKARRRAADIYAAQAFVGQTPAFGAPKQVARYLTGVFPGTTMPQVLERNKVNARMFQDGKVPFLGDYIAAAAVRFVLKDPIGRPGEWVSSAGVAGAQSIFHLGWTDNRLVRGNVSANPDDPNSKTVYTPPSLAALGESDPTTPRGGCVAATVGTRDQTVFASRLYPDLILVSPSASKPTKDAAGQVVGRAFPVYIQNTRPTDRTVASGTALRLEIAGVSPAGSSASFSQDDPQLATLMGVEVAARSSTARTVFVQSPALRPVIRIDAFSGNTLVATTYINGNPNAAPLEDALDETGDIPDNQVGQIELHTPEFEYRATSIGTPAIDDPAIDDPAIDDPAIDDPAIDDPAIDDPAIDDPAIDDPAIDDPAIDDPAIDDPAIDDPAIDDPAIDDAAVAASAINDPDTEHPDNEGKMTQITWKIKLDGNTTTSLSTKVFIAGDQALINALNAAKRQLIVSRRYRTNDIREGANGDCVPVRVSSYQVIANIVDPVLTSNPAPPDQVNPPLSEPSTTIPPGSSVYLTLRVWGEIPDFTPEKVGAVVTSQPDNPVGFPPSGDSDIVFQITTTALPEGTQGVQYAQQLAASGGVEPYTWSIQSGVLPGNPGQLTLSPSGLISGTSSIADAEVFVVKVTDANGLTATRTLCLRLVAAPNTIITTRTLNSDGGPNLQELITAMLGGGVTFSNVSINGSPAAAGTFEGGTNAVGFDSGILLSSGSVSQLTSVNTADNRTTAFGTPGDAALSALVNGAVTHDALVIEFDFKPTTDKIKFEYVFGSDEYNEYANTGFNDVFAFFVNGVNYALLPGTSTPVAINTVNGGNPDNNTGPVNPQFYRNNDPGNIPIEADGLTVVLTLEAPVVANQWNHIRLAIADTGDQQFDSWVFIKGGSFQAVENCANGLDDDGDGKVDAADPDCACQGLGGPVIGLATPWRSGQSGFDGTPVFEGLMAAARPRPAALFSRHSPVPSCQAR
jgi:hypothetical protein